jgi:hypothetical protein
LRFFVFISPTQQQVLIRKSNKVKSKKTPGRLKAVLRTRSEPAPNPRSEPRSELARPEHNLTGAPGCGAR